MIYFLRGVADESSSIDALENLAFAGISGFHLVVGDRETLDELAKDERVSLRARAYFRKMAQMMTQYGSVVAGGDIVFINVSMASGDGDVSLDVFENADYCEKAQLLVENLTDADVLIGFSRHLVAKGMQVNLRRVNGGGSTTAGVMNEVGSKPSGPFICVVDSDRKFRDAGVGDTAKAVRKSFRGVKEKWRARLHIIDEREIENIIPEDVAVEACRSLPKESQGRVLETLKLPGLYKDHCCLKDGDSLCRMLSAAREKGRNSIVRDLRAVAQEISEGRVLEDCNCGESNCFSSSGLGKGFLARVAVVLSRSETVSRVENWSRSLRQIVESVVWCGIAAQPIRI